MLYQLLKQRTQDIAEYLDEGFKLDEPELQELLKMVADNLEKKGIDGTDSALMHKIAHTIYFHYKFDNENKTALLSQVLAQTK